MGTGESIAAVQGHCRPLEPGAKQGGRAGSAARTGRGMGAAVRDDGAGDRVGEAGGVVPPGCLYQTTEMRHREVRQPVRYDTAPSHFKCSGADAARRSGRCRPPARELRVPKTPSMVCDLQIVAKGQ